MDCNMLGLPVHHQLPELAQTHVHRIDEPANHLILCHPLLFLPSIFFSIRVLSDESAITYHTCMAIHLAIQVAKVWEFQFQHQSFQLMVRIDFL